MNWTVAVLVFLGFTAIMFYLVALIKVAEWAGEKTGHEWVGFMIWMSGSVGVFFAFLAAFFWKSIIQ